MLLTAAALAFSALSIAQAASAQTTSEATVERTAENGCVENLPFARGGVFCSLDEYLAHLQQQGAIDLPWWREIQPCVY